MYVKPYPLAIIPTDMSPETFLKCKQEIDVIFKELMGKGDTLEDDLEKSSYKLHVRSLVTILISKLEKMRSNGAFPQQLHSYTQEAIKNLESESKKFLMQSKSYQTEHKGVLEELNQLEEKISQVGPPVFNFESFDKGVESAVKAWERDAQFERMVDASVLAAVGDALAYPVEKLAEGVVEVAKKACKSDPKFEKSCRRIAGASKKLVQDVSDALGLEELLEQRGKHVAYEAKRNEQRLGIPQELTKQYHQDAIKAAALAALVIPGPKKIRQLFTEGPTANIATANLLKQADDLLIKQPSARTAYDAVCEIGDDLLKSVPDFSKVASEGVGQWAASLNISEKLIKVSDLARSHRFDSEFVARLDTLFSAKAVKRSSDPYKILSETIGLQTLCDLGLKELELPTLFSIGQGNAYFMVKSYMPGVPLDALFDTCSKNATTSAFLHSIKTCEIALEQAGRAMGELQSKTFRPTPSEWSEKFKNGFGKAISDSVDEVNTILADKGWKSARLRENEKVFDHLTQAFLQNPGELSWGFCDISLGQFIWSAKKNRLAFVDAEFVLETMGVDKLALASSSHEFYSFLSDIQAETLKKGFTENEVLRLTKAFERGYCSLSKVKFTNEAKKYFNLYNQANVLRFIAGEERVSKNLLQKLIDRFNHSVTEIKS